MGYCGTGNSNIPVSTQMDLRTHILAAGNSSHALRTEWDIAELE